jgi:MFS family permease
MIAPVLPLLIRGTGATMSEIGLLMMFQSLAWAIFEPTFGLIADKVGKKNLMIYSIITTSFIYVSYAFARNIWHFALIVFALSSNASAGSISTRAMTAELLPSSGKGRTYGRYMAFLSMGQMIGPLIGGFLADRVSRTAPFYVSGAIGAAGLIAGLLVKYEKPSEAKSTVSAKQSKGRLMTRAFLGILAVRLLYMFNMSFQRNTLPIFLNEHENLRASETEIGVYMGILTFVSGLSQLFLGGLADRFGSKRIIISGLVTSGLSYLALPFLSWTLSLYVLGIFQGVFFAAGEISMMIYFMAIIPVGAEGKSMGFYGLAEDIGGMIASPFMGEMYDTFGPISSVYSISAVLVSDGVMSIFAIGLRKKDSDYRLARAADTH